MLFNAITLQEAEDSSEIENIIMTQDVLHKAYSSIIFMKESKISEIKEEA